MTKFITPHEYETMFHIVSNTASQTDGDRYDQLQALRSKLAEKGTTGLNINFGNEGNLVERVKEMARHAESEKDLGIYLETLRGMRAN